MIGAAIISVWGDFFPYKYFYIAAHKVSGHFIKPFERYNYCKFEKCLKFEDLQPCWLQIIDLHSNF